MADSILEKLAKSLIIKGTKEIFKKIIEKKSNPSAPTPLPTPHSTQETANKVHPWRLCEIGRHWVETHPLTVPESKKNPSGKTIRHGHCADNPSGKHGVIVRDYMDRHEIDAIAENEFSKLRDLPRLGDLFEFPGSEKYDSFIQGWTKYWNDVIKPSTPLDPNIIKALIASESSFKLNPKIQSAGTAGKARGFIQLTDEAVTALGNVNGELKDHFVKIRLDETTDANMSICAATRWIFQKQKLASHDLNREATWIEAVEKYKGALNKRSEVKESQLGAFYKYYEKLKNQLK